MEGFRQPLVVFTGPAEMMPVYSTDHAAGADLKAHLDSSIILAPGERGLVPTGLRMAIPQGWEGQVRPRSGLAFKYGLTTLNSPGTIDADYRGEIKIILINHGEEPVEIQPGMRIAQLVISAVSPAMFQSTDTLPATGRDAGGFGSTGF